MEVIYFLLILLLIDCIVVATTTIRVPSSSFKQKNKLQAVRNENKQENFIVKTNSELKKTKTIVATDSQSAQKNALIRGIGCIIGGALVHLTLGTMYCWGNFLSYAPENLRFFDGINHKGKQPDALYVIPFTLVAQAIAMPFGPIINNWIGPSKTLLLGSWITALSVFIASYQKSLKLFMLFYSIMFGLGVGIAYTAPMTAGWKWLPNQKGLVTGGILAGFGAGGFFFSLIGSKISNPLSFNTEGGVFPPSVYEAFPRMLRTVAGIYFVLSLIGSLCISESIKANTIPSISVSNAKIATKPIVSPTETPSIPGFSLIEALRTEQFWLMWVMIISSATTGLNTVSIYKQFAIGKTALVGDSYQALVGGIGALFNGSGRLIWGILFDKLGFKTSYILLTLIQLTSILAYSYSIGSKVTFAINTCMLFFCLAGNLALMPPATQQIFGPKAGTIIYGVLFSAFGIASVVGGILNQKLIEQIGWSGLFKVLGMMSFFATVLVTFLKPIPEKKQQQ